MFAWLAGDTGIAAHPTGWRPACQQVVVSPCRDLYQAHLIDSSLFRVRRLYVELISRMTAEVTKLRQSE